MKNIILFIIIALTLLMPNEVCAKKRQEFSSLYKPEMEFYWKKKNGKYALIRKQKGYEDWVLTDYVYDVCKDATKKKLYVYKGELKNQWLKVEKDNKFGIINLHGEEVLPCVYDKMEITKLDGSKNFTYTLRHYKEKYTDLGAFVNYKKAIIIAKQNGKYGIIDFYGYKGITKLDFEYDYIGLVDYHLRTANNSQIWNGVDNDESADDKSKVSLNCYKRPNDERYYIIGKDYKYGLYDRVENKIIIDPIYNDSSFELKFDTWNYNSKNDYLNINGMSVRLNSTKTHQLYDKNIISFLGGMYLLKNKKGKRVLYNTHNGKTIYVGDVKKECIKKTDRNLYYHYSNDTVVGCVFDNGYKIEVNYRLNDIENFEILPIENVEIFKVKHYQKTKPLYGLYNAKLNKEILAPKYTKIIKTELNDGFFLVEKDTTESYYAYIPSSRDTVLFVDNKNDAFKNATLVHTKGTMSFFKQGNCWGVNDTINGLVVPCIYDSIKPIESVVKNVGEDFKDMCLSYYRGRLGVISPATTVTLPYFTDIVSKSDTLMLTANDYPGIRDFATTKQFKMFITTNEENELIGKYNWSDFLNPFVFEAAYNLAVYTDYRPFLEATAYERLDEIESVVLKLIADGYYDGADFAINRELKGFARIAYVELGIKDLQAYNSYKSNVIETLEDKVKRLKAEKERERQQQYEEQLRQQRIAAEQARLERQQQWENLAAALGNMANNINAAVNSSKSRKKTYNNNNTRRSSANNHSHSSTSSGSSVERCDECGGDGKCTKVTSNLTLFKTYCRGTGKCHNCIDGLVKDAFGTRLCSYCNGSGKCYHCKGTGKCTKCHGTGKIKK